MIGLHKNLALAKTSGNARGGLGIFLSWSATDEADSRALDPVFRANLMPEAPRGARYIWWVCAWKGRPHTPKYILPDAQALIFLRTKG